MKQTYIRNQDLKQPIRRSYDPKKAFRIPTQKSKLQQTLSVPSRPQADVSKGLLVDLR